MDVGHFLDDFVLELRGGFAAMEGDDFVLFLCGGEIGGSLCYLGILFSVVHLEGGQGGEIGFVDVDSFVDAVLE